MNNNIPEIKLKTLNIPSEEFFLEFKKNLIPLINLDLRGYKNKQMDRRITTLMQKNQITSLNDYLSILKKDPKKLEEFLNMLTINVTEFFRNKNKFEELENIYLPQLLEKKKKLRIWSSGCSIGAEVYSVCMILDKLGVLNNCEIIASDFDSKILQKAQNGIYEEFEYKTVLPEYKKLFTKTEDNKYKINEKFSKSVKFEKIDLLNAKFQTNFDLILCRNVVIYFTDESKDKLYENFYNSLINDGILFIGSTERINNYKDVGYKMLKPFFYQK